MSRLRQGRAAEWDAIAADNSDSFQCPVGVVLPLDEAWRTEVQMHISTRGPRHTFLGGLIEVPMSMIQPSGIIFIFDIGNKDQFKRLPEVMYPQLPLMEDWERDTSPCLVLGCKCDQDREVSTEELKMFAESWGMLWAECSAKTGEGVEGAFEHLVAETRRPSDERTKHKVPPKKSGCAIM
eukprot:Hpha_TRINITY_DN2158_c0_g1::TRINITY_DN2158_c0_g1_i2::g.42207::m.42207